jgi:putative transposase
MMKAAESLSQEVGVERACNTLGLARASYYRWATFQTSDSHEEELPVPSWTLSPEERQGVLDVLHTDRFVDQSAREVYATMLDEGTYLCSVRSMYRILNEQGEVRERRDQLRHPVYQTPELLATGSNQVWSWDITKLKGPVKWTYYYLYVLLDIFSR